MLAAPEFHATNHLAHTGEQREEPAAVPSQGRPYKAIVALFLHGACIYGYNLHVPTATACIHLRLQLALPTVAACMYGYIVALFFNGGAGPSPSPDPNPHPNPNPDQVARTPST